MAGQEKETEDERGVRVPSKLRSRECQNGSAFCRGVALAAARLCRPIRTGIMRLIAYFHSYWRRLNVLFLTKKVYLFIYFFFHLKEISNIRRGSFLIYFIGREISVDLFRCYLFHS